MKFRLSEHFYPLLDDRSRYLVLSGGRGSGKSEFAVRKLFYRCQNEGRHRFLILRKVRARCRESVVKIFKTFLHEQGVPFDENKTELTIKFGSNELLFEGLDDPEKLKSIKGVTGIWMEEATGYTERDFIDVDMVLREPGPLYHQIILTFNPDEAQAPWLKKTFFDQVNPDATVDTSTVEDNPSPEVRRQYLKVLEALKEKDENLYKIYRLGKWGAIKGRIFPDWDVVPKPTDIRFDNIFYGGDFGYSVDPAAVVRIYRRSNEYWLEEVIYQTELTNPQLAREAIRAGMEKASENYWDAAEPKSIKELQDAGIDARPALKGPDSVRAGIDFMRDCKIHIIAGSENIIKENQTYKWKEGRNGEYMNVPVDYNNHAMDAIRYGIYTEAKMGGFGGFEIPVF